jgi:hypothetical protein
MKVLDYQFEAPIDPCVDPPDTSSLRHSATPLLRRSITPPFRLSDSDF